MLHKIFLFLFIYQISVFLNVIIFLSLQLMVEFKQKMVSLKATDVTSGIVTGQEVTIFSESAGFLVFSFEP